MSAEVAQWAESKSICFQRETSFRNKIKKKSFPGMSIREALAQVKEYFLGKDIMI